MIWPWVDDEPIRSLTVAALKSPTHQTAIQRQIDATDRQIDWPPRAGVPALARSISTLLIRNWQLEFGNQAGAWRFVP